MRNWEAYPFFHASPAVTFCVLVYNFWVCHLAFFFFVTLSYRWLASKERQPRPFVFNLFSFFSYIV